MHTIVVLSIGFALLVVCALTGRTLGGTPTLASAMLAFLPLWFIGSGINMYLGVKRAGYRVAEEAPMFLLVFAVPAAAALLVWYRVR